MRIHFSLAFLALLLAGAQTVHAASGVAMRWDHCYGEGGENNKNFACDTNTGSEKLVLSYVPASTFPDWSGLEIVVDALSGAAAIPSWWQMKNVGTCRQSALTVNVVADPAATHCIDNFQVNGAGGIGAYNIGFGGSPNRARLLLAFAVPQANTVTLSAGVEYFAGNIVISHTKTVGTGACAGCAEPFCLIVQSINLVSQITPNQRLVDPIAPYSAVVGWQGGSPTLYRFPASGPPRNDPGYWSMGTCLSATPTNHPTWGAIKSLYR